jgi:hypothetical protein
VSQQENVVVEFVHERGVERAYIHVRISGRRAVIVRLATRALKALRTSTISLRPRCARLAALTARIAIRFLQLSAAVTHTDVLDDVERRRYCLIIFAGCHSRPSTSPDVEHVRIVGLRPRFVPLLNSLLGCLFVRRHVRGN